jgi:hypothetical protein
MATNLRSSEPNCAEDRRERRRGQVSKSEGLEIVESFGGYLAQGFSPEDFDRQILHEEINYVK